MRRLHKEDVILAIQQDQWMMDILKAAKSLNLPDWWVCAGFIRSKVWDVLHDRTIRTPLPDVDVIYFDPANIDEAEEKKLEEKLKRMIPDVPWSVKNEARMHTVNNFPPYISCEDAISKFPETATALGASLDTDNNVILIAPYGIEDLVNMQLKPTPYFCETVERNLIYEKRINKKNWKYIWPKINVIHILQDRQQTI